MRATVTIPDPASFDAPEPAIGRLSAHNASAEEAQSVAGVGVWHYDYASDVVSWSHELYGIFGVSPDTFQPTFESFLEFVHPDDREAMLAADRESTVNGKPMNFEHRIVRPDGVVRYVHERAQIVIRDELGGRPVLIGTTQDITERKEAEKAASAQDAKMEKMQARRHGVAREDAITMAETLADEINEPLSAITNYAAGMRRIIDQLDADNIIATGMAQIESNALRAGEIVRRMRETAGQSDERVRKLTR